MPGPPPTDTGPAAQPIPPGWPGDDPTVPDELGVLGSRPRRPPSIDGVVLRRGNGSGERSEPAERRRAAQTDHRDHAHPGDRAAVDDDDLVAGVQPAGRALVVMVVALVLAMLVALASGIVMTAVAGADRAASALDRLLARTLPATVLVAPPTPGFDWAAVRALPEVQALTELVFSPFEVDGRPAPSSMMFPPADSEAMSSVERPVVLEGRLADPSRADEVVVTPAFTDSSRKGVGDTVSLRLFTPEQVDAGHIPAQVPTTLTDQVWILTTEQAEASLATGVELETTYHAAGPAVEATIVGVVRSPWFSDTLDGDGFVVPSAGLYDDYSPYLLGANGSASINAMVRLRGGEAVIPRFQSRVAEITGRSDIEVWNLASATEKTRDVIRFEAASLIAFAVVAGLAATLLIGLAMARYAASTVSDLQMLTAVGITPRQSRRAALLRPTLAAARRVLVGGAAPILPSQWFPVGSASVVEQTPGPDVDLFVRVVRQLAG